jgi:hypothetical protein
MSSRMRSTRSRCHGCGSDQHFVASCPKRNAQPYAKPASAHSSSSSSSVFDHSASQPSKTGCVTWVGSNKIRAVCKFSLRLSGWWSKDGSESRSRLVDPTCTAYSFHAHLLQEMSNFGLVDTRIAVDARNCVAHVQVKDGRHDMDLLVRQLPPERASVDILLYRDYIAVDVGYGKHMTLHYQSGLLEWMAPNIASLVQVIENALIASGAILATPPTQASSEPDRCCVICLTAKSDTLILPCKHLCLCQACSTDTTFNECPMCRGVVESVIAKIYEC